MQRPPAGDPFSPVTLTAAPSAGYVPQPPHAGTQHYQLPPSPFAVANPTAPGTGHRSMPTVGELFHSFKRRWVLVLMVGGLLGTVLAAAVWMAMPSGKHQARVLIQMHTEPSHFIGGTTGRDPEEFKRFKENELAKMRNRTFLATVATDPEVAKQPIIQMAEDKGRVIGDLLTVKEATPEHIEMTMNGDDSQQLRVILTKYVEAYVAKAQADQNTAYLKSLADIKSSVASFEAQIIKKRAELIKNAKEKGANPNDVTGSKESQYQQQISGHVQKIEQLTDQATTLRLQLEQYKAENQTGAFVIDQDRLALALKAHPKLEFKQARLEAAKSDLAKLNKSLLPGAPKVAEAEAAVAAAQKEYDAERKGLLETVTDELRAIRRDKVAVDIKTLENSLALVRGQISDAEQRKAAVEELCRKNVEGGVDTFNVLNDLKPLIDQRDQLNKEKMRLEVIDANRQPRVELLEGAQVYINYNLKQKMILAAGTGILGLMSVMLLISYLEWRNRRVDGVDQVVTELGMRVIGTIPAFPSRASLRNGDASQNQNWRFILNESVNSTRTMLLHTAKTQQMQVIMVTSAMQGEGKTSLSSQLATSMATAGLRTLILDFDLRNPSMQKLFDVAVAPGCCEILLQEVDVSDTVQPTTVPNLWIVPAGQCNHRVIAALAQGHPLETLFNRLRGQFDIIVVDSCPILPVADSLLVAQHVDGVVFSILQDVSQLPKVLDASERLVQLAIPLLGAVVNGIKPDIQAYGYNYVKQLPA